MDNWEVDLRRFRIYLKDKYKVVGAYYFLGYKDEKYSELYEEISTAGFTIIFKEHNPQGLGLKKGNVDSDIIFEIMKTLLDNNNFDKIILVSGDGDYKKIVDYLILKDSFLKILFPNIKFASSLYRKLIKEHRELLTNLKSYIIKNK